jgi:hypothetical protein
VEWLKVMALSSSPSTSKEKKEIRKSKHENTEEVHLCMKKLGIGKLILSRKKRMKSIKKCLLELTILKGMANKI